MSKIKELAKKLHILSLKGDPGEKDNAKRMLDELLAKHGLRTSLLRKKKSCHSNKNKGGSK